MPEKFIEMLLVGGHTNSLGRVNEVIEYVLHDHNRINELYNCLFYDDAWVRMRAADALEKICRQRPTWIAPFIDNFQEKLSTTTQASIQWHLAQIYRQISLTPEQKVHAIEWLKGLLKTVNVDWIVAANAMDSLVWFTKDGSVRKNETIQILNVQLNHKSNEVKRRANKLLDELNAM